MEQGVSRGRRMQPWKHQQHSRIGSLSLGSLTGTEAVSKPRWEDNGSLGPGILRQWCGYVEQIREKRGWSLGVKLVLYKERKEKWEEAAGWRHRSRKKAKQGGRRRKRKISSHHCCFLIQ